jgi:pantoate--beta-alanine ligase
MFIFKRVHHLRDWIHHSKAKGKDIGFVPTMGALHFGHMSLVGKCQSEAAITIVSIFVNPKQFNDPLDLEKYPRPLDQDLKMLHESGVDAVFIPEVHDIYPPGDADQVNFDPGPAAEIMEGKFRPGHFKGMAEVVYRLLEITTPDHLFMGQKDFQQFAIIRKLIADFRMPINLVLCPTIREAGGLAMSSRNVLLSDQARRNAAYMYHVLKEGKESFEQGETISAIQERSLHALRQHGFDPEYFEVINGHTMQPVENLQDATQIVACCAVKLDGVRLIDNVIWKEE